MSTVSAATPTAACAQLPQLPALVVGDVTHQRPGPVRHDFRHRVYQWLVDLDSLPRQPWYLRAFAHFSSADHLGDASLPIKANIENYLALNGIRLGDRGRVLMLANARVLGARALDIAGHPAVLLVLPGDAPGTVKALAVSPTCSAANTGLSADRMVTRP